MFKKLLFIAALFSAGAAHADTFKAVQASTGGATQAGMTGYAVHLGSATFEQLNSTNTTITKQLTMPSGSTATFSGAASLPSGSTITFSGTIKDRTLSSGTTWDYMLGGSSSTWSHAGLYLQFISSFDSVGMATALTTFQNTKLGVTITPKFTSSMLILEAYATGDNNANTGNCFVTFSKGNTNLSSNSNGVILYNNITARVAMPIAAKYVDTNLTSGTTTYWVQVRSSGVGTCTFGENTEQDWMYVTEIGR